MLDSQIQPKLGLIPNDGCRPFLKLELPAAALTAPPPAVDWFSKLTVPLGMYGNDQVGDCVAAAIIHDYLVSWCATHPGQTPPVVPTTQDALDFYWSINTDHVDRGLVTQTALEKLLANGICGIKPLAFATVDLSVVNVRAVTGFFVSAILSVEIDQAQYYPAKLWDDVPGSPFLGYHGISSGSLAANPDRAGIATWGYVAQLTDAYITNKVNEVDVIVWPWVYNALPSETAAQLAADFHAPDWSHAAAAGPAADSGPADLHRPPPGRSDQSLHAGRGCHHGAAIVVHGGHDRAMQRAEVLPRASRMDDRWQAAARRIFGDARAARIWAARWAMDRALGRPRDQAVIGVLVALLGYALVTIAAGVLVWYALKFLGGDD